MPAHTPASKLKGFKAHLPTKPCAHCQRLMSWRKKWERTWDDVRYCSDRCRQEARRGSAA
jgi:hypothetical protein